MTKPLYETNAHNTDGLMGIAYADSGLRVQTSSPLKADEPGTNPEELFGLAWATCLHATIEFALKRHHYEAVESDVTVNVQYRSDKERRGYTYFALRVDVTLDLPQTEAEAIMREAHDRCPVSMIVGDYAHVTLRLNEETLD